MNSVDMGKLFHKYGVYDALQFILSAHESINTAYYCKNLIENLSNEIEKEHEDWRENLEWKPLPENDKVHRLSIDTMPSFSVDIAGIQVSKLFLRDMMIKDFFQYSRNAFDAMAQAANSACLASRAKRIETVDFTKMRDVFQQQTYSTAFPVVSGWFSKVGSASEYNYIDVYCNRTKHTCEIRTKTELPIFGDKKEDTINPFFRQNTNDSVQNDRKEIITTIVSLYSFLSDSYREFVDAIKLEIPKRQFIDNRYYTLSVYQQKMKDTPDSNFSMAYIEANTDINNMPEQIQVLLIAEIQDGNGGSEIVAKNCPFDTIYIKEPSKELSYIGKYVTEDIFGVDELLRFRRYTKVYQNERELPLMLQAMTDEKQKGTYYHANPFVNVITVSDDDSFLNRVSVPF